MIAVSSPYHMYRIGWEARRRGVNASFAPAVRPARSRASWPLFDLRQHIREIVTSTKSEVLWIIEKILDSRWAPPVRGESGPEGAREVGLRAKRTRYRMPAT